ncbi:MAG: cobalamin-dependent protein [Deltaproteobacteria bacterium]|nr:cobalamin-dependent protein [Deltaproteobacteria bacterium]
MKDSLTAVQEAIKDILIDDIKERVQACLDDGMTPVEIIEEGIGAGLEYVGRQFEEGTYFLADLILAGEMVKEVMPLLEARMDRGGTVKKEPVILATVRGDIHEIGKNIVGMLLQVNGYEVIDLGVDVPAEDILAKITETNARLVGLSALLTTMVGGIREVVDAVAAAGLKDRVRIVIGGACTSDHLREEMGADAYGESAVQAVKIFDRLSAA